MTAGCNENTIHFTYCDSGMVASLRLLKSAANPATVMTSGVPCLQFDLGNGRKVQDVNQCQCDGHKRCRFADLPQGGLECSAMLLALCHVAGVMLLQRHADSLWSWPSIQVSLQGAIR